MHSLTAILAEMGVLSMPFERTLDDFDVPSKDVKALRKAIAQAVLNLVVQAGTDVVDDFEANQ